MKTGKLQLVGAGPGDEELITVKGMKALQAADVVLFDALANPALLNYCKSDCEQIFVGKRSGLHFMNQEEINSLILQLVSDGKHVVRLKGGDPFVFGRGHEEMQFVSNFGIPSEMIPGISSSTAVPGLQNIPVTKRGVSESFWVVTGTTQSDRASEDLQCAARSSATVVVLMGMKHLRQIVYIFRQIRGDEEPVGVMMNGTREEERCAFGTLANIEMKVIERKLAAPAIIVIGAVVSERLNIEMVGESTDMVKMASGS